MTGAAGRAKIDPNDPRALGICDRCGFLYNLRTLRFQWLYAGTGMINVHQLVCPTCYDRPNEQLRAIVLPPDPPPKYDIRPEPYSVDERNEYELRPPIGADDMFAGVSGMSSALLMLPQIIGAIAGVSGMSSALRLLLQITASIAGVGVINAELLRTLVTLNNIAVQQFTANGTYTPTPGMVACLVIGTGAGGGSGGAACQNFVTGSEASGGAGGGGATCFELFTAAQIGASQAVTIGAGGTAGANTGTAGGNGGDTTLGALFTAGGGLGGAGSGNVPDGTSVSGSSGAGGAASGGFINIPGGGGRSILEGLGTAQKSVGGGSFWGTPATAGTVFDVTVNQAQAGVAGTGFGCGAQGGYMVQSNATQTDQPGAVGSAGYMFILEFLS